MFTVPPWTEEGFEITVGSVSWGLSVLGSDSACGTCPLCLHKDIHSGFSTFSALPSYAYDCLWYACDSTREFYDNATLVLQIHIIREDKRSYSQRDIWAWTEGSYAVIFRDSFERIMTFLQEVTRLSCDNGCWLGKQRVGSQICLPGIC